MDMKWCKSFQARQRPYLIYYKGRDRKKYREREREREREGGRGRDRGDGEKQHDLLERETQLP